MTARVDVPSGLAGGMRAMFVVCFAALGLLWMPVALLRQVDAFLGFLTPLDLARDVGLAYLLLLVPALLLSALGAGLAALLRRAGVVGANAWGWCLMLAPTLWICLWQLGGGIWTWIKAVAPGRLDIGYGGRMLAATGLVIVLVLLLRRLGLRALLEATIARLAGLRGPALVLLVPAFIVVAMKPPRLAATSPSAPPAATVAGERRPDIYLITIDTLAEADAQVCGNAPTLMPRLREFTGRASCMSRHYANANYTTPSTSTIETGVLPWSHWAVQFVAQIAKPLQQPSLATRLREAGYETHSINANLLASPRRHGTGEDWDSHRIAHSTSLGQWPRAMLTWFSDTTLPYWFSTLIPLLDTLDIYLHGEQQPHVAEYAYDEFLQRLDRPSERPRFFWVHTLPPHDPYLPPPETKHRLLPKGTLDHWKEFRGMGEYPAAQQGTMDKYRLRYRESIMGADAALGRLFDELRRRGKLDNAVVLISSDHGESFERGFLGHAGELIHNAVLQIPLVVRLPGQDLPRTVDQSVSLVDLAPTILDLAGAAPLADMEGRSLRPALEGGPLEARPVFAMAMERQSRFKPLRGGHYAVIDGDHKLVFHLAQQRAELYDLRVDPLELHDLGATRPDIVARLRAQLEPRLRVAEQRRSALFGNPAP